jgi:phosphinothricin acetyltransferase
MVEIKKAIPEDFPAIADIYNESIQAGTATMEEGLKKAEDIAGWVSKFNDRERLFIMEKADTILGWAIIKRYSDREGYRFACETAVYITASQVGKGYGSTFKRYLLQACKELNYKHLVAKIFSNNTASIVYNQKLGYTIVGKQNRIGFKNNEWLDVVIMQYIIE